MGEATTGTEGDAAAVAATVNSSNEPNHQGVPFIISGVSVALGETFGTCGGASVGTSEGFVPVSSSTEKLLL